MTRFLLALTLLLALPVAAQARPGDPDRRFGRQGTVTLKATSRGRRRRRGQGHLRQPRARGRQRRRPVRRRAAAPERHARQPLRHRRAGRPRAARHVAGRRARARDLPRRADRRRRARCGSPTARRGSSRSACCRPARSTRASAPASATCWPARPAAELGAMTMDRNGNVILGGSRPSGAGAEMPIVIRLLPDGTPDPTFAAGGTFDGAALGLGGRVDGRCWCGRRARSRSPSAARPGALPGDVHRRPRCCPTGAPDPTFGAAPGSSRSRSGPGSGAGVGAQAVRGGPGGTTLVAGTDLTDDRDAARRGHPAARRTARSTRASAQRGITRISRAGRRDPHHGHGPRQPGPDPALRLRPPARTRSWCACAASGARDNTLRQRRPDVPAARPPAGRRTRSTRRFDAIDAVGSRAIIAGSAAGPGALARADSGTLYTGRFALTVSKLPSLTLTRSCSQGTCGSCSGFISTLRRTRTPSASISTSGCAAANAAPSIRSVDR